MNNLVLIVKDGNTSYDVSDLIIKVTWSGRKGAAPRTVEAVLHDSEQLEKRAPINCGKGQKLFLYEKDSTGAKKELFRGQIMSDSRSEKRQLKIKAYDAYEHKATHPEDDRAVHYTDSHWSCPECGSDRDCRRGRHWDPVA